MNLSHKISKITNSLSSMSNTASVVEKNFFSPVGQATSMQGMRLDFPSSSIHSAIASTNSSVHGDFFIGESKWAGPQRVGP